MLNDELRVLSGNALLDGLAAEGRWDIVEALWLSGNLELSSKAAKLLAGSGIPEVVDRVALGLLQRSKGLPGKDVILAALGDSTCSDPVATEIFDELVGDTPVATPQELSWLLRQPSERIDSFALRALTDPNGSPELKRQAARRLGANPRYRTRAWNTLKARDRSRPAEWSAIVQLMITVVGNGRAPGLAETRRALVREFVNQGTNLPPSGFVQLALADTRSIIDAVALADSLPTSTSSGVYALLSTAGSTAADPTFTVELAFALGNAHPAFWTQHYSEFVKNWDEGEWIYFFDTIAGGKDLDGDFAFPSLVTACPEAALISPASINAASALDGGDGTSAAVTSLGRRLAALQQWRSTESLSTLSWVAPDDSSWEAFKSIILLSIPDDLTRSEIVAGLAERRITAPEAAAQLIGEGFRANALSTVTDDEVAYALTQAIVAHDPAAASEVSESLATVNRSSLVRGLAAMSPDAAFGHVEGAWNQLPEHERDEILDLLEDHSTAGQMPLLDAIVSDTTGTNRDRRIRAGRKWSELAPQRSPLPPGIVSLFTSGNTELARTGAAVAAKVCPTDQETLVMLRDRWASADDTDPLRNEFRQALDTIDEFLAAELGRLERSELQAHGPAICHALGTTAGTKGFQELVALLGPEARDDNVDLRRAAARALKEFFSVHPSDVVAKTIETLGQLTNPSTGELDTAARKDLAAALRSASLGPNAALAMLDPYLGAEHELSDLLEGEREAVVRALNGVATRRALGPPGYSGLVQQLDVVLEHLARATYLVVGQSEKLKQAIRADPGNQNSPIKYRHIIDSLRQSLSTGNLEVVHDLRCTKTEAHGSDDLTDSDVQRAENAFEAAAIELYQALKASSSSPPNLRVVDEA